MPKSVFLCLQTSASCTMRKNLCTMYCIKSYTDELSFSMKYRQIYIQIRKVLRPIEVERRKSGLNFINDYLAAFHFIYFSLTSSSCPQILIALSK